MAAGKSSRINRQYKTKYRIRNWRESSPKRSLTRATNSGEPTLAPGWVADFAEGPESEMRGRSRAGPRVFVAS